MHIRKRKKKKDEAIVGLDADGSVFVSCNSVEKAEEVAVRLIKRQQRRAYTPIEYR